MEKTEYTMIDTIKRRLAHGCVLVALFFVSSLSLVGCDLSISVRQVMVTEDKAAQALEVARSHIDDPYLWGGNGPDSFDCSGLVVHAYQSTYERNKLFMFDEYVVHDVTADALYRYNVRLVESDHVIPGDLVFISSSYDSVTHVGLVSSISGTEVNLVHASSYNGCVVEEPWPLDQELRGQHLVGFGRLLVVDR